MRQFTSFLSPGLSRHVIAGAAAAIAFGLTPVGAEAQEDFPSDTIEVVSHASPGGGTDTTARMMMKGAQEILGEDMVVVYKQGGGARAAHEYFASQPPTGHAIMALTPTHLYTIARGRSPITIDDMIGVARAMADPTVIAVSADSPYKTYEELIAASKEEPLAWGVAQVGGTEHIGLARWAEEVGVEYRVVPFGSGGEMIAALLSGAIDATVPNVSEAKGLIEEDKIRALAVMNEEPLPGLPDVPTTFEKGHEVAVATTRGYAVPAGTPPEQVKIVEEALIEAMHTEAFENYLRNAGLDPETSVAGREVWDEQLKEDYAAAKKVLDKLGLTEKQ